jgi:hypothetical protein
VAPAAQALVTSASGTDSVATVKPAVAYQASSIDQDGAARRPCLTFTTASPDARPARAPPSPFNSTDDQFQDAAEFDAAW